MRRQRHHDPETAHRDRLGYEGLHYRRSGRLRHLLRRPSRALVTKPRRVIVHIATSADGYIARADGDLEWLTSRPAPKGFYGMDAFMKSIDTEEIGRKKNKAGLQMGTKIESRNRNINFSLQAAPPNAPSGME